MIEKQMAATEDELMEYKEGDTKQIIEYDEDTDNEVELDYKFTYDDDTDSYVWKLISTKNNSPKIDDWVAHGFDKTFEGEFNLDSAIEIFNKNTTKEQFKALQYAAFYCKNNVADAKDFVIFYGYLSESSLVKEQAFTLFKLFFRNHLRTNVKKHYMRLGLPYEDKMDDALGYLWLIIVERLPRYDPKIAKINTFFSDEIIDNELQTFDGKNAGEKESKPTLLRKAKVFMVAKLLKEDGIEPEIHLIQIRLKELFGLTLNASTIQKYMDSRKNIVSLDAEENENIVNEYSQTIYAEPERHFEQKDKQRQILDVIKLLTPEQTEVFKLYYGVNFSDNTIVNYDYTDDEPGLYENPKETTQYNTYHQMEPKKIAQRLGITENRVQQIIKEIIDTFDNNFPRKERVNKALAGKTLLFTKKEDDDFDLAEFLLNVDEIEFEDIDGKFTRVEDLPD